MLAYSVRRTSAVDVRAAMRPGIAATTMAKMIVPTPTNRIDDRGIDASGTASMLRAKSIHSSRPMTMPRGIPKRAPKTAATVACQAIAEASCRCVKPSAFKSAKSRQRRRTDAPSVMPSAAIAPNANRQEAGQMATETRPMTKKAIRRVGSLHR
jgi:hypothetical protein